LGAPFFNYLQEILDFPLAISTSICHSTATIYSGLHLFIGITGLPSSGEFSLISFGTKTPGQVQGPFFAQCISNGLDPRIALSQGRRNFFKTAIIDANSASWKLRPLLLTKAVHCFAFFWSPKKSSVRARGTVVGIFVFRLSKY